MMLQRFVARVRQPGGTAVLRGSAVLLVSMTVVNLGNLGTNLVLGRWLGPLAFADVSLFTTLLLLLSFVTTALAQATARSVAVLSAAADHARVTGLQRWLAGRMRLLGIVVATALVAGAPLWAQLFHTEAALPFVLLGVGMPFLFDLCVMRGVLQGNLRFGWLALSYQTEMAVRLLAVVALVTLGWGVNGAVGAIALSLVAAWWLARRGHRATTAPVLPNPTEQRAFAAFVWPIMLGLVGHTLLVNGDVLLIKHLFPGTAAGQYAALALIGRIVFFATNAIVTALFPIVAQRQAQGREHQGLLLAALAIVGGGSALILAALLSVPALIVRTLFGEAYLAIVPLLALFGFNTTLYALSNVVVNYRLSLGNRHGSLLVLLAGVVQLLLLTVFHGSLLEVVTIQSTVMCTLLAVLVLWNVRATRGAPLTRLETSVS